MLTLSQIFDRLSEYQAEHEFPADPLELYEPCNYVLSLGGKRLRPALLLMAYDLFSDSEDMSSALPAAWAVELFHNFSLVHDDIMDAAPLRRGKPTVHTRWSQTTGILSGDVILIYAYDFLKQAGKPEMTRRLLDVFNRVAIEVCEGQQYDMNFEKRNDVSLEEYIRMIELKTAVLIGGALQIGALCAGASEEDAAALYDFGRHAGIAFQLQDDLLDTYGDPAKFGKQVGGDIVQNKKTYLVLKTLESANSADKDSLLRWMDGDANFADIAEKIATVRELFDRNGAAEALEKEKKHFEALAFSALDLVKIQEEKKAGLKNLVKALVDREQ